MTRKPTSGFTVYFLGTPIQSGSRKQAPVTQSSAESELYAICAGTIEALRIKEILKEAKRSTARQAKALLQHKVHQRRQSAYKSNFSTGNNLSRTVSHQGPQGHAHYSTVDIFTKLVTRETLHRLFETAGLKDRA